MGKLADLIGERRRRQEKPDRVVAIFHIFIDPVTKREATDLPRQAIVIGGPRLQQEPKESGKSFEARVVAVAEELRKQVERVA
jgi:hypothetical protein